MLTTSLNIFHEQQEESNEYDRFRVEDNVPDCLFVLEVST